MPIVNGTLTDFGLDPLAGHAPRLTFRPATPGVAGLNILSAKAVEVVPASNGYFEVELASTQTIAPATHYVVQILWTDTEPTRARRTETLPWKLFVPPEGGALGDLLRVPANPALAYTGTEAPYNPAPGMWWLDPSTGDLSEFAQDGVSWTHKANLTGPAGYNATGAAEDAQALADFASATAGANPFSVALGATISNALADSRATLNKTAADRSASLSRAAVEYTDNAGFTDEFATMAGWEATAAATAGAVHNGPTGPAAQRRLAGLDTGTARVIGSIKVVAAGGGAGGGLTLLGLTRNTTANPGAMIDSGFFGIGVTEANQPTSYPGGALPGPALAPGTYHVSIITTAAEIVCTLYTEDGDTYHRYSYPRAAWGESPRVGLYNSDSRNAAGNTIGPVAARAGYVTANPRGTVETAGRWTRYAIAGDNVVIGTPAGYDSRQPLPWVIYAHGYGDLEETVMNQPAAMQPVLNALLAAGYGVAAPNFGGTANWGNPAAVDTMRAVYRHLRDAYTIGPVVLIGHSMGGLVTLNSLTKEVIPGLAGWVGIEPVVSLESMYSHPAITEYADTIKGAYGIAADGSDYAAKTAGHDPATAPATALAGVPMLVFASPADTAVYRTENAEVLQTKVAPENFTLVDTVGGHVDPSHFQPSVVLGFINKATRG